MNIISQVVEKDRCIGCGVCVGICPRRALTMGLDADGNLVAQGAGDCADPCGLCIQACPFADGLHHPRELNGELYGPAAQPGAVLEPAVGWHLGAGVGYSTVDGHRERGASGGLATWYLEELLRQKRVDRVAVVRRSVRGDERLFRFRAASTVDEVRDAAGSAYYPVSIDDILRRLDVESGARWAIVGVPCLLAGVRRAMRLQPARFAGILHLVGLACGTLPNSCYTELLVAKSGVRLREAADLRYRCRPLSPQAGNYRFVAWDSSGRTGAGIPYSGLPDYVSRTGLFRCNPCNFCADLFAEAAEICFMDAWLEEYRGIVEGTSIFVSRSAEAAALIEEGRRRGALAVEAIDAAQVRRSQQGQVWRKQVLIALRTPRPDVSPLGVAPLTGVLGRADWWLQRRALKRSKSAWRRFGRPMGGFFFWTAILDLILARGVLDLVGRCRRIVKTAPGRRRQERGDSQ